jgi:hypothetical protein
MFFCGAGFSGAQSTTRGTGIFLKVTRSGGISGWSRVWGAGISFAVCCAIADELAELMLAVDLCGIDCGPGVGVGYAKPPLAACRIWGCVL